MDLTQLNAHSKEKIIIAPSSAEDVTVLSTWFMSPVTTVWDVNHLLNAYNFLQIRQPWSFVFFGSDLVNTELDTSPTY